MGWGGAGPAPWGLAPWGLGGSISSVDLAQVPDEGGVELTIFGAFQARLRATVEIGGASCSYPGMLGGVDASGDPGAGPWPVASSDGGSIKVVVPQLPIGFHDLTVQQPGLPQLLLANAVEVVRRDFWTRLHSLRQSFPTPPFPPLTVGPKQLRLEGRYSQVGAAGDEVPALQGMLHSMSAALLEASAVLYSRLVAAPFRSGSVARIWSSSAADVGQLATVRGTSLAGAVQSEVLALNGLVVVVGAVAWGSVDSVELDLWGAGSITVADDAGTAPERIVVGPGFVEKKAGEVHEGDLIAVVEGNWRFPASGRLALSGEVVEYASKVMGRAFNSFVLASPGATRAHALGEMVADASAVLSALEIGRRMMLPEYAEGRWLDVVAARYGGVERPGPISDALFRPLYEAIACGPKGTLRILESVLEVVAPGAYEIIEEPISFTEVLSAGADLRTAIPLTGRPCTVYIDWGAVLSVSGDDRGKSYLCGGELATSADATHVPTLRPVAVPYGVYRAADLAAGLGRSNNYCDLVSAANDAVIAAPGAAVASAGAAFLVDQVGKPFVIEGSTQVNNGVYRTLARPAANSIVLEGMPRPHGYVDPGHLDFFAIDLASPGLGASGPFGPSSVGKTIRVIDTMAGFPVDRVIVADPANDQRSVRVSPSWPAGCSGASWCFWPALEVEAGCEWRAPLATASGSQIVLPRALPGAATAVVVDYASNRSAELSRDASDSHASPTLARPFYLAALDQWLFDLLCDLVPAGVHVEQGTP